MNIFYLPPDISSGSTHKGVPEEKREPGNRVVTLGGEESLHAVKVLRLREGDPVVVVDGCGNWYEGEISGVDPRKCGVRLSSVIREYEKLPYRLYLGVGPTKNSDRTGWLVEKATEIGIEAFTPVICRNSERRQTNRQRLEKVAIAAMKQSQKAFLPVIDPDTPFEEIIGTPFDGAKFIAHCYPGEKPHLKDVVPPRSNVLILVGPEGDFSPEEVEAALRKGFREVTLGPSRLRTETAALVACHTVALLNQ